MAQKAVEIQKKLKTIQKKEPATVVIAISKLNSDKQQDLLENLIKIETSSSDREREERKEDRSKSEEEGRFIGRLKERINDIKNEETVIKTRFSNCRDVLLQPTEGVTEDALVSYFARLNVFIAELNLLHCLANFKQGEIVARLKNLGFTTEAAAKKLQVSTRFAERLFTFYGLASRFTILPLSGYSFETLLKYKKLLERTADADEDFRSRLELDVTIMFEDEKDDALLEDAVGGMEKMQSN